MSEQSVDQPDSGPLDDEETAHAADSLSALLDAEESSGDPAPSSLMRS